MEKFELHILGCGSALPTTRHFATSQVVNLREKLFMIDCGEGAQMQLRRSRLKFSRLNHIFISHLHGDHCFGLLGLISTFGLLGRTADLHIHSPRGLEELFAPMLAFFCKTLTYKVFFHEFETKEPMLIYDDRSVTVTTIPLKHRIPCCGFLFEEKQRPNHIIRDMVDFYKVPVYELNRIKNRHIDLAFVVLDPRLGDAYYLGMEYFLKNMDVDLVFPMHMWKQYDLIDRFKRRPELVGLSQKVVDIDRENIIFDLN